MKIAITGHSRGIGASLYEVFKNKGHEVIGFSRSNGFDISNNTQEILSLSNDADVFINNAYHPTAQLSLLEKMTESWNGTDKIIVNISSKITYYTGPGQNKFTEYILAKNKQNNFVKSRLTNAFPRILNVVPGFVDTDMTKEFLNVKTDPNKIAEVIYSLLEFKEWLYIQEIIVDVPKLNWEDIKVSNSASS
jgi:NAD(P)-dependent dehydrogenase (short-subunit alcohol dehydrogenase family)